MYEINQKNEDMMRQAFQEQALRILANQERFIKPGNGIKIGFESEIALHSEDLFSESVIYQRDGMVKLLPYTADVELGALQLEFRTPPVNILKNGIEKLSNCYHALFEIIVSALRCKKISILRCGSNPFVNPIGARRTDKEKYRLVPDFHNTHRRKNISTLIGSGDGIMDIGDASVVGLFQSFQVNWEADSLDDAIQKMNYAMMICPYLLAIAGNTRYLKLRDTGYNDLRMPALEISHDVRTEEEIQNKKQLRVGLPENYFKNAEEYFERTSSFLFILNNPEYAFPIGIGLHWLDTRVKIIGDSAVVELRILPTQSTIDEEIALALFFIGRVRYAQKMKEILLPIEYVRQNRTTAMKEGLNGLFWLFDGRNITLYDAPDAVWYELQKAKEGLRDTDLFAKKYIGILEKKIEHGSPSDMLAEVLKYKQIVLREEMIHALAKTGMLV